MLHAISLDMNRVRVAPCLMWIVCLLGAPACDLIGQTCTHIGCDTRAKASLVLAPGQGTRPDSEVRACKDSVCHTAPLPGPPEAGNGAGVPFNVGNVEGTLWFEAEGRRRLEISWRFPENTRPPDGQSFKVEIVEAGATAVLLERTGQFVKFAPNGEDCGPVCWQAMLAE